MDLKNIKTREEAIEIMEAIQNMTFEKTKEEKLVDYIKENFMSSSGYIDIRGLDFGDCTIDFSRMKAKSIGQNNHRADVINQTGHNAKEVFQSYHTSDEVTQSYHVATKILQEGHEADIIID